MATSQVFLGERLPNFGPTDNNLNTSEAQFCRWPHLSIYREAKFKLIQMSQACVVFPPFAWSKAERTL